MKFALRDLFWLLLLTATLIVWGLEHRKLAKQIDECRRSSFFIKLPQHLEPSPAALKRRQARERLSRLSNTALNDCLSDCLSDRQTNGGQWELCLAEMARRKMVRELQAQMQAEMMEDEPRRFGPPCATVELLTALRRAQGKPDPLSIEIVLNSRPPWAADHPGPCLQAIVKNCDVDHEPFTFFDGGDDRGGRRERWRFILTDEHGKKIRDSNYQPWIGGGVCTFGPLEFGKSGNRFNFIDLRRYISPPPSGSYQLQAFYHNSKDIADEVDLSGLIVSSSDPINVVVHNPAPPAKRKASTNQWPLFAIIGFSSVMLLASITYSIPRSDGRCVSFFGCLCRRDVLWALLILVFATSAWIDQQRQARLIYDTRPDAGAEWTIRPAD